MENKRHPDGRIYAYGDGVSKTVSPYHPGFMRNIEDEIKPIIRALVDKNYLPYSSCAGHSVFKRRFFAVAFPDEKTAEKFKFHIELALRFDYHGILDFKLKRPEDYMGHEHHMNNVKRLNTLFMREYKEYVFLEVSIGLNSPPSLGNIFLILRKLMYRDKLTKKIEKAIKSDAFPSYWM